MSRSRLFLIFIALVIWASASVQAQTAVVYGVFFYSPSCPHCHEVIENHWPQIQEQFGDQLQVLFVDISTLNGSQIMQSARTAMNIQANGVPMLIIGSEVLVGSLNIPARTAQIVQAGLDSGGIGLPPIPGIAELFEEALGVSGIPTAASAGIDVLSDPANLLAIGLLVVLAGSLLLIVLAWNSVALRAVITGQVGWIALLLGIVSAIGLTASLILGSLSEPPVALIAGASLILFAIVGGALLLAPRQGHEPLRGAVRFLPLIALAGMLVAGYLMYVETTLTEAVCGVVGDCNVVQQSAYARVAGVPIGVIGVVGYGLILLVWALKRWGGTAWADRALFGLALFGTIFSLYLTSLEPFVIGATCVWCLTSAAVMGILLWMTAPLVIAPAKHPARGRR
ncbi:MAG: hypothetical protein L6Q98_13820 [Anaerolineae bacterium]|nr:hypothetical protein [Anaerolineae bacterium]NUQ05594.1 hypothetical protein [Anaerolineae bacterium]